MSTALSLSWLDQTFIGEQGPAGPAGPAGGSQEIELGENAVKGDVICSANDADNPRLGLRATAVNLALGGSILGVLDEDGSVGETKTVLGDGEVAGTDITGIDDTGDAGDAVILDTATARCVRTSTPSTSDWRVGTCDEVGNTKIKTARANELHVLFEPKLGRKIASDGVGFIASDEATIDFSKVRFPPDETGTLPDRTGVVSCYDHMKYAESLMARAKDFRHLLCPVGRYLISRSTDDIAPGLYDDDSTGYQQGCRVSGEVSTDSNFFGTVFDFELENQKTTTAGTFVSRASGSVPQAMWRMGGWTGLSQLDVGKWCWVRGVGCKNAGWWYIAAVNAGGTEMSLYSPLYNATGGGAADRDLQDDTAASGTICGIIVEPYCYAQHAQRTLVENIVFVTSGDHFPYAMFDIRNPEGPGKVVNFRPNQNRLSFVGSADPACMPIIGMNIAALPSTLFRSQVFTVTDLVNDVITAQDTTYADAWQISTGSPCKVESTGSLPSPLVAGTTYFARVNLTHAVTLHTTQAGALAGTGRVNLTTSGTGVHTVHAFNYYLTETGDDGTASNIPQVGVNYGNCDVGITNECSFGFGAGWQAGVQHGNANGQSIQWTFRQCLFAHSQGYQYVQPKQFYAIAHEHFEECAFSMGDGFAIDIWNADRDGLLKGCYSEAWGGLIYTGGAMPCTIIGQHCRGGAPNAMACQVYHGTGGPLTIIGGLWGQYDTGPNQYGAGSADVYCATVFAQGTADFPGKVSITGVENLGAPQGRTTGVPARLYSGHCRGTYKLDGTEELWIEVAGDDHALQAGGSPYVGIAATKVWKFVASGSTFTDVTTAMGNATAADVTFGAAVGDIMYFGFDQRFCALLVNYSGGTAGIGGAGVWEYLNASGAWVALTVGDDTATIVGSPFTHAVADNLMIDWRMPQHAAAASTWKKGTVNGTTDTFWVRFRVTTLYSTAPVVSQITIDHRFHFTFTAQDIADACSSTATRYHTLKSGLIYPIFSGSETINTLPIQGSDALDIAPLFHLIRTINFQAALYEWDLFGLALEDQTRALFSALRPGAVSLSNHFGSNSRVKGHTFTRSGKRDFSGQFGIYIGGLTGIGHGPYQVMVDTAGMVEIDSLGVTAEADGEVTYDCVTVRGINSTTRIANSSFSGRAYGPAGKTLASDEMCRQIVVQIRSTGVVSIDAPGFYSDGKNLVSLGASNTKTLDLLPSSGWGLPKNARYCGCAVYVNTKFQNAGDTDVTDCSVGTAADHALFAAAGTDLKTTGYQDIGAFTAIARQMVDPAGALVALQLFLNSDVLLNTITAGKVTVEFFYRIQQRV